MDSISDWPPKGTTKLPAERNTISDVVKKADFTDEVGERRSPTQGEQMPVGLAY